MRKPKRFYRIIFVGIHNKPGLPPLCSSTKTGKIIDRIIAGLTHRNVLKSNLYNFDAFPETPLSPQLSSLAWAKRINYNEDNDIVICLGQFVRNVFTKANIPHYGVGHPSGIWSNDARNQYVNSLIEKLNALDL